MKYFPLVFLSLSAAIYIAQVIFYTTHQELVVYGIYGALWYLALLSWRSVITRKRFMLLLSFLAAFGLGFVPHRLRLGSGMDPYVILFPVAHFVTTGLYLFLRRRTQMSGSV